MSWLGRKHTEETKRKLSKIFMGHLVSDETKAKISASKKGKPSHRKGKKHTEEANKKNRLAHLGKPAWNKGKILSRGDKHFNWKGNNIGNSGVHQWVARVFGKPRICWHCGTTTAKKFEWASKSHEYRRDKKDFLRLCTRCHRRHDYLINRIMKQLYANT